MVNDVWIPDSDALEGWQVSMKTGLIYVSTYLGNLLFDLSGIVKQQIPKFRERFKICLAKMIYISEIRMLYYFRPTPWNCTKFNVKAGQI